MCTPPRMKSKNNTFPCCTGFNLSPPQNSEFLGSNPSPPRNNSGALFLRTSEVSPEPNGRTLWLHPTLPADHAPTFLQQPSDSSVSPQLKPFPVLELLTWSLRDTRNPGRSTATSANQILAPQASVQSFPPRGRVTQRLVEHMDSQNLPF